MERDHILLLGSGVINTRYTPERGQFTKGVIYILLVVGISLTCVIKIIDMNGSNLFSSGKRSV